MLLGVNMSKIRELARKIMISNQYQYVIPILNMLKNSYAIIKGEALSLQAYGKTGARLSSDIDILITRGSLSEIEILLCENGFLSNTDTRSDKILMLSNSHQVSPWIKNYPPLGTINIDINFDVFWGEYEGKRIDIDEFISDTIDVEIYGVKARSLPPIKSLIQLVLHHYKDMNSIYLISTRNSIKNSMFKDVYYLLKNNLDTIQLEKLYTISEEYEIIPYVFYILYYTGQVFDDKTLKQYIEAFRTSEGESLLNCYGLCAKERKEWKCDFKTRLETNNLYELIKNDLTEIDHEKIAINKRIFLGVEE